MDYTQDDLKQQFKLFKEYALGREKCKKKSCKVRLPNFPEDISENIIKTIIEHKFNIKINWNCKGDLLYEKQQIECKCFSSNGPISFSPSSKWDEIYFLDARTFLKNDNFVLYKCELKRSDKKWENIKVNSTTTFSECSKNGKRPRIIWKSLYSQISDHLEIIFEGTFKEIFKID
jgi:hypothetical protein